MKITISGYKSIAKPTSISVTGLTLLSGANSSGKSSFMQPLLIIKQTAESNFETGSLLLDGVNVKLFDSSEILSKGQHTASDSFSIDIEEDGEKNSLKFKKLRNRGIIPDSVKTIGREFPQGILLTHTMKSEAIGDQLKDADHPFASIFREQNISARWMIRRRKCFIGAELVPSGQKNFPLKVGISPAAMLEKFIKNLIHVPGLRGNPERTYRVAAAEGIFPGSFESYVASIIHKWQTEKKHAQKYTQLIEDIKALGLATQISTTRINDTRLVLRVSRHSGANDKDCVNIADVGFGVSQVLPVLVALITARKGQCVYIEQPELHLHPRAQHSFSEILVRTTNNGVRVIIETHSAILLRGIQTLIAKKKIPPEKVSLNWFTQDPETGASCVCEATPDEQGAFGDWPTDFDEVGLSAESQYLDAIEESINGDC